MAYKVIAVLMFIYVSLVFYAVINEDKQPQTRRLTIYTAKCLDGIFSGEVEKRGDRYYYNDKQIWLPLSQCVLEEK